MQELKPSNQLPAPIAVSPGALIWFDMLNKIIVVRSTAKPKEKSPDEPSRVNFATLGP
jgi:hypothetical protein